MLLKISIITINKNNASGLEKTCLSVITQTYQNLEWIVIDGASEDNSVDIINKYTDKMTYWVSEPDTGIYNAMNKGIKIANGEYYLFLNSGDYLIHPWTIENVLNEIIKYNSADVYYSDVLGDNYILYSTNKNIDLKYLINNNLNHQNCLIKNNLFEKELYDEDYKIISDSYFLIKMLINYDITFCYISNPIAYINGEGYSNINKELLRKEKSIILNKLNLLNKQKNIFFKFFFILKRSYKFILPYGLYKIFCRNEKK